MVPISKNGFNKAYLKIPNMESSPKKKFCHQHNLLTIISFRIFFFSLCTAQNEKAGHLFYFYMATLILKHLF